MAGKQGFRTQEELLYGKKRLLHYLSSGMYRTAAMKRIKMSESVFKRYFENDEDIKKALEKTPKLNMNAV